MRYLRGENERRKRGRSKKAMWEREVSSRGEWEKNLKCKNVTGHFGDILGHSSLIIEQRKSYTKY